MVEPPSIPYVLCDMYERFCGVLDAVIAGLWPLPVSNPIVIVAIAMTVFLLVPLLFSRLRLPSIVGMIIAGAVLGPSTLGVLARDQTIELAGTVGLLYLMFIAGLDIDLIGFNKNKRTSGIFGLLSFTLPLGLALLIMPLFGFGWAASLLAGAIVASHTLLAYPIVSRLGISKNPAVVAVVGGTLFTDTLSLLLLAAVSGVSEGAAGWSFWLLLLLRLGGYAGVVVLVLPRLGRWFLRNTNQQDATQFIFLMAMLFITAFLAELAGAAPIIGAFLAGLCFNRLLPETSALSNRITFVGNTIFIPFFLFSVGMLVDFSLLVSLELWLLALTLTLIVSLGKGVAALLAQRMVGYSLHQGLLMAGLSIPQAAATLAVTFVGLDKGLFDSTMVNAVIVLILFSCIIGPLLVERYGRSAGREQAALPYDAAEAPKRILIPLANPKTAQSLMNLAFMLREPNTLEPVFPLSIIPEEQANADVTQARVAHAEAMLAHAVIHAAAADVPVSPSTRLSYNIASGVVRAISEQRISHVVIGWNGQRSAEQRIFGSVIDQLLQQSQQQVMVCKLEASLHSYKRIVLVIPPYVEQVRGYYMALRSIKLFASRLGVAVHIVSVALEGEDKRLQDDFKKVSPAATLEGISPSTWSQLRHTLLELEPAQSLPLVITGRPGSFAWDWHLPRLLELLQTHYASYLLCYPATSSVDIGNTRQAVGIPQALHPQRVHLQLQETHFGAALVALLSSEFSEGSAEFYNIVRMLSDAQHNALETLPHAFIAHGRIEALSEPMMFLGINLQGIRHPESALSRQVLALLLSPAHYSVSQHLQHLADFGAFVHRLRHDALLRCQDFDELQQRIAEHNNSHSAIELAEAPDILPATPP